MIAGVSDSSSGSESDSGSASESDSSVDFDQGPDELHWLLSKGSHGHLHVCKPFPLQARRWHTLCNRGLKDPEYGVSLHEAFGTGRPWSPRCFSKLPQACKDKWQTHQQGNG